MTIAIFAVTTAGHRLALSLLDRLTDAELWTIPEGSEDHPAARGIPGPLSELVAHCWGRVDQCVFVLTTGAVVRLIAPLLAHKSQDPGVVTVDQSGRWVISLSGGHQGGADALARQVAALLGVDPVITSATEQQTIPALDLLGDPYGWRKGAGDWTAVMAAANRGDPIQVVQTCGWDLWRKAGQGWGATVQSEPGSARIWISDRQAPLDGIPTAAWHPRVLWAGVGCERGASADAIEDGIRRALETADLAWGAIAGVATIALKQDEPGLLELCHRHQWPLKVFASEELAQQSVPHPSEVVRQAVGSPSVAEAAALCAAQVSTLVVTKQIRHRPEKANRACTVAIAQAEQDYNPRPGLLGLIGTGPGDLSQLTGAARAAIAQAEVLVGYGLYLDLVKPLIHPNQVIESSPITQEIQRADRAIALAQRGLRVAVLSSGDIGIYGMGGLVLERLSQQQWDGQDPGLEVFPGVSAFQAAAARLGAPLMHDFCCISLSDLLTPWPLIEGRIQAAAQGDFVIALYNPRSQRRTEGIRRAQQILLTHRDPKTPVALARCLYRPGENILITTLEQMDPDQIDMLTLVLVGNGSTFVHQGSRSRSWLITPRGYGQKQDGSPKQMAT